MMTMTYEDIHNKFKNSETDVVIVAPDARVQEIALGISTLFEPGSYSASRREWTNGSNAKVRVRGICSPEDLGPDTEVTFFPITRSYTDTERKFIKSWRSTPIQ